MSRRTDLDEQQQAEKKREPNEQERHTALEEGHPTIERTLKGIERPINDQGDTLFVSDTRPLLEVALDNSTISNERFFLYSERAGNETGRASASIQIERDENGSVVSNRTRLHDIVVNRPYRGEGLGAIMLQEIEQRARHYASTEVYGQFAGASGERAFYERNGYRFRPSGFGGEEVYKPLA
jgi:GNAT superfamily N-acetyltransferase